MCIVFFMDTIPMVVLLYMYINDFCYYRNCLYTYRYRYSSEKEQVNESPSTV